MFSSHMAPQPVLYYSCMGGGHGFSLYWNSLFSCEPIFPAYVPITGRIPSLCCYSQFYIICKLLEGGLYPIAWVINENIKKCWVQHQPVRYAIHVWTPGELWDVDHKPLRPVFEKVFNPPSSPIHFKSKWLCHAKKVFCCLISEKLLHHCI